MARRSSFELEDLLKAGRGEFLGPHIPRLPLPNMLMLDRIVKINEDGGRYGRGEIIAELDIRPDLWFFSCHFKGDPVMPGSLGLDALWQLLGFYTGWMGHRGKGRALGVAEVKFRGQVLPSAQRVTYHVEIKRLKAMRIVLAIADGTLSVDGCEIYTAKALRVGIFESLDDL